MEVAVEINRDVYLDRLIVRKHNGFIKVITGIRRSGKSYLLNILFYNHLVAENIATDHIIKFAFDSAEDLIKIGENPKMCIRDSHCTDENNIKNTAKDFFSFDINDSVSYTHLDVYKRQIL